MRLTKRSVEGLPLKAESYIIWDGDVKGFGVRIYPSGKRSYVFKYRSGMLGLIFNCCHMAVLDTVSS